MSTEKTPTVFRTLEEAIAVAQFRSGKPGDDGIEWKWIGRWLEELLKVRTLLEENKRLRSVVSRIASGNIYTEEGTIKAARRLVSDVEVAADESLAWGADVARSRVDSKPLVEPVQIPNPDALDETEPMYDDDEDEDEDDDTLPVED